MNYIYAKEKLNAGDLIKISLNLKTNIMLIDKENFEFFKNDKKFRYYGGKVEKTPFFIEVPFTKEWFIVIRPINKKLKYKIEIIK